MKMKTHELRYPQCRCARFGQSRFEPVKRTALDGKVWWCMRDHRKKEYVPWYYKFKTRREALVQLAIDFKHGRIPHEPDPGFDKDWLVALSAEDVAWLMDHRRLRKEKS